VSRPAIALLVAFLQTIRFEPVQPELFGAGRAFVNAWADYDGDGDPDLFVGFDGTPNRLYRNNGGTFEDVAAAAGVADARSTRAAAWGDFDADGDPDLLVGFAPAEGVSVLRLYRNSNGTFSDATGNTDLAIKEGAVRQPAWVDFDGDEDLDLFVAFRDRANALFRQDKGTFVNIASQIGLADTRRTVGAFWFDFDLDGDLDLAVANMDGDANGLFRNDPSTPLGSASLGAGRTFTDVAQAAGVAWGGRTPGDKANGTVRVCAADVNNDGRFDLFAANYGKNGLFLNQSDGRFKDVSAAWGIAIDARYDTCVFEDFDHDGRVDLYVNGTVTGGKSYPDYLFRNLGNRFVDITPDNLKALQADHGAAWADYDGDGDADLALTGAQPNGMHLLLANRLGAEDAARSLKVRVVNARQHATLPGAEVRVFAAGTNRLIATRLVDSGTGYDAQNDLPVHIGLPTMSPVDVEVVFPRAGTRATVKRSRVDPRQWRGKALAISIQ
jgi:hypothetical protein